MTAVLKDVRLEYVTTNAVQTGVALQFKVLSGDALNELKNLQNMEGQRVRLTIYVEK